MEKMSTSNPWSRPINYASAIAEDERNIALFSNPVLVALCQSLSEEELDSFAKGYHINVFTLFLSENQRDARRAMVGLTAAQAAQAVLCYQDGSPDDTYYKLAAAFDPSVTFQGGAFYREGSALVEKLCSYQIMPESKRVACLKKAKTSLARHKRNQIKWGIDNV